MVDALGFVTGGLELGLSEVCAADVVDSSAYDDGALYGRAITGGSSAV